MFHRFNPGKYFATSSYDNGKIDNSEARHCFAICSIRYNLEVVTLQSIHLHLYDSKYILELCASSESAAW